jgi:hypothetical protein
MFLRGTKPVMGNRIRIRMCLGIPEKDPLVRGMDPDPDPAPDPDVLCGLK